MYCFDTICVDFKHERIISIFIAKRNLMKQYQVITTSGGAELSRLVQQALNEGWTLQGGVTSSFVPNQGVEGGKELVGQLFLSQALVR